MQTTCVISYFPIATFKKKHVKIILIIYYISSNISKDFIQWTWVHSWLWPLQGRTYRDLLHEASPRQSVASRARVCPPPLVLTAQRLLVTTQFELTTHEFLRIFVSWEAVQPHFLTLLFFQPYVYPWVADTVISLCVLLLLFHWFIYCDSIVISIWGIICPSLSTT